MKKISYLFLIMLISWSCQNNPKPAEPNYKEDLSAQLEGAVLWYQNSAEMQASYLQAYAYGKMLIDKHLENYNNELPAAVVLDLDETVLDNSPFEGMLIKNKETYGNDSWNDWVEMANAEILPGAKDFISYAKSKGVEVIYISNRLEKLLGPTLKNMQALDIPNADSAHVLLKKETSDKTERRALLTKSYNVLVYVGDNLTDFSELYANRGESMGKDLVLQNKEELLNHFVMLPNPMYGEWEKAIYKNDWSHSDSAKLSIRLNAVKAY
jgi:5'-nucleotidase (lipoprotein e(P4) family)